MPDGNAPSARVPTPSDDANASSRPLRGARAPAKQPSPVPPETHEQRLETLIAELTDARYSGLPLTDLLRAYDEELERIRVETVRNGGTIPLTMREQTLLTRAEAAREAITTTRTDDPRAQARELATRAKAATNPALAKGLRAELAALQQRAREDGLTRELQRDPSSDLSVIDDTITRAEQGPAATSSAPDPAPEAGSMLLARQVRALKARLERAEQELEHTNTSANALETSINELEQAPVIEIRGVENPFSSADELEHLRETQQRLLARQATLQTIVQDLTRANATLESLDPNERETLLQASEEADAELDAPRDPLIDEGLARSRTRLAAIIHNFANNRPGRDTAVFVEAYERVVQPLNDLETPTPAAESDENTLSAALRAVAAAAQASAVVSPSPATTVSVQQPPEAAVSTTTTEEATIQSTREELRARYAVRQQEQAILTTYRTQLQAHSWTYLQTHNPTQFQRLQTIQTELATVIDPSSTLPPDALETVHQQALVDVRAAYPDVTDAVLSTLLLSQATTQLASASALQAGLSTASLQTALGAMAGATAAAITAAGLVQALGAQQQAVATAAEALAQEEAKILQRATTLTPSDTRVSTGDSDATPDVVMLRQAQQESASKRRGLQAKLNVSLQQLDQWSNALGGATGTQARGLTPEALQALAVTSPKTFVFATKAAPAPQRSSPNTDRIPFDDTTRRMRRQQSTFAKNQALAAEADEPDGIDLEQRRAAHLDSVKARTKRALPRATEARSSSSERSASTGASVAAPLLALAATPTTPQAIFADRQARMNRERDAFIGVGDSADSGYEATFGTPGDADDASGDGSATNSDDAEMAALAEAQDQATEQAWEAELLRQQQQDARAQEEANNQPKDSSGRPTLQQAKQAGDLLKKAGSGAITGTVAAILVVVLILWLNIRLFFPNPESSWRKPLEPLGKLGVVLLDGLMILLTLLQFLFLMLILFLPILAIILPGVIIAGTLLGGLGN